MSLVAELISLAGPTPTPAASGERADAAGFAGLLDAAGTRPRGLLDLGRRLAEQTQAETARIDGNGDLAGGEALILPGLLTGVSDKLAEPLVNPGYEGDPKTAQPLVNPGSGGDTKAGGPLINPGVPNEKVEGPLINPGLETKNGQPLVNPGEPLAADAASAPAAATSGPAVAAEVLEILAQSGQAIRADAAGAAVRQAVGRAPEVSPPAIPTGATAQADVEIETAAPVVSIAPDGPTATDSANAGAQLASGSAQAGPVDPAAKRPASEPSLVEATSQDGDAAPAEMETPPPAAAPETGQPSAVRADGQPVHRMSADAIAQISAQIIRRLEGRATRFDIELNPHDLGKVDVRLDIDAEGRLAARLAFDNPAAATELRGRVDDLRRDLEQAGFLMSDDAFSFADREGARDRREGLAEGSLRSFARSTAASEEADAAAQPAWRVMTRAGLDMRV